VKYEKQKIDINQHVIKNQQQRTPGQPDITAMIVPDPKGRHDPVNPGGRRWLNY
jgi:hypothetical protein